jgi:hypothetical protein
MARLLLQVPRHEVEVNRRAAMWEALQRRLAVRYRACMPIRSLQKPISHDEATLAVKRDRMYI